MAQSEVAAEHRLDRWDDLNPSERRLPPWLPVAALTGVFGESMLSRWMDLGRPRLCLAPPAGRGLMTVSMSSISFSCFRLRYSCLMNSLLALSSSFLRRSSSAFSLNRQNKGVEVSAVGFSVQCSYYLLQKTIENKYLKKNT